jgi:large subunit ribosomal protein L25
MELVGQKREILGKKTKFLREDRLLPAVIFGKGLESLSITIKYNDFVKVFKEAGETSVFDILVDGKKHPVLVKDVQVHHVTSKPIHVGFYEVNLTEKLNANIPVEVINEEENTLVKNGEAIILVLLNEIEVEALPTDLPENFTIDAIKLADMDSTVLVSDLEYNKEKVEIVGIEPEEIVVKLDYAQMLEEEEEEEIDEAEALAGIEATEEKEPEEEEEGQEKEKPAEEQP